MKKKEKKGQKKPKKTEKNEEKVSEKEKKSSKLFKFSSEYKKNREKLFEMVQGLSIGDRMLFDELFDVFETHVGICKQLKEEMKNDGVIIEKEYVKGRPTIVAHPAITNYNASSKALNSTASQLSKLFDKLGAGSGKEFNDLKTLLRGEVNN